jgi:hypothetical protein
MQTSTHLPEQGIIKKTSFSDIPTVTQENELFIELAKQQSYPLHPNYERLINRSFYGYWQV